MPSIEKILNYFSLLKQIHFYQNYFSVNHIRITNFFFSVFVNLKNICDYTGNPMLSPAFLIEFSTNLMIIIISDLQCKSIWAITLSPVFHNSKFLHIEQNLSTIKYNHKHW